MTTAQGRLMRCSLDYSYLLSIAPRVASRVFSFAGLRFRHLVSLSLHSRHTSIQYNQSVYISQKLHIYDGHWGQVVHVPLPSAVLQARRRHSYSSLSATCSISVVHLFSPCCIPLGISLRWGWLRNRTHSFRRPNDEAELRVQKSKRYLRTGRQKSS